MLFELINFTYVLILLIIVKHFFSIKPLFFWILFLHFLAIYFFNGLLFSPTYMPDQFAYFYVAEHLRALDFGNDAIYAKGSTVLIAGILFALFPLPFIHSIYSLSAINYLLYLYLFLFMHKKKLLNSQAIIYFYLFYPSLLLYSSVALRDMLIFFIMFFGLYFLLIRNNYLLGILVFFTLKYLKFQNLLIIVLAFILGKLSSITIIKRNFLFLLFSVLFLFYFFGNYFSIQKINHLRLIFYNENKANLSETFIYINSYIELIPYAIQNAIKLMFRPLPWEEFGKLKLLQFIENCFIFVVICHIIYSNIKNKLYKLYEIKILNLLLCISLLVYGLIAYNSGTAVRYKFPFVTIYVIFSYYFIYKFKKSKKNHD